MTHSHTDRYQVDWAEAAPQLAATANTEQGWYAAVAGDLVAAGDRLAVDVGCGGGGMTRALAQALPNGRVVGVDAEPALLDRAREHAGDLPGVDFLRLDLTTVGDRLGPELGAPADVVWASEVVHHAGDQQAVVRALAAPLAPGGRLALAEGGLQARRMPWDVGVGEPGLEIRLNAAQSRWFTRMRDELPDSVRMPYGWPEALRRAGLERVTTRSWLLETPTPLSDADRAAAVNKLAHRVEWLRPTGLLDDEDLAAWDRLLDPESPQWLGARPDLFHLTARSVHIGLRP